MASLNQCNFIGNVGKIESRFMASGDAVTNISLAVNESWKGKDGSKQESVEWVNAVMYKKLAEIAQQYVKVGDPLYISGKLKTRKWADKAGVERYTTEIIADEMKMLSNKGKDVGMAAAQRPEPGPLPTGAGKSGFEDMDDDLIPF